jgi:hypothetical protein
MNFVLEVQEIEIQCAVCLYACFISETARLINMVFY